MIKRTLVLLLACLSLIPISGNAATLLTSQGVCTGVLCAPNLGQLNVLTTFEIWVQDGAALDGSDISSEFIQLDLTFDLTGGAVTESRTGVPTYLSMYLSTFSNIDLYSEFDDDNDPFTPDVTSCGAGVGLTCQYSSLAETWFFELEAATDPSPIGPALSGQGLGGPDSLLQWTIQTNVPSPVPLPAAAWLFISALGGLVVAKRK